MLGLTSFNVNSQISNTETQFLPLLDLWHLQYRSGHNCVKNNLLQSPNRLTIQRILQKKFHGKCHLLHLSLKVIFVVAAIWAYIVNQDGKSQASIANSFFIVLSPGKSHFDCTEYYYWSCLFVCLFLSSPSWLSSPHFSLRRRSPLFYIIKCNVKLHKSSKCTSVFAN